MRRKVMPPQKSRVRNQTVQIPLNMGKNRQKQQKHPQNPKKFVEIAVFSLTLPT
jgi:hypothetical protein